MDAVGGIAGQREARGDEGAGEREPQREGAAAADDLEAAQLVAEAAFQLFLEDQIVAVHEALCILRALAPDERRAVAGERQGRERAGGQEMLLGRAVMRAFVLHGGDDAGLAVIEAHRLDAGHVAQFRAGAVAGDEEARADLRSVGKADLR